MLRVFLILIAVSLAAILAPGTDARADAQGPACIVDGDTMHLGGRRAQTECIGGIPVILYGVEAPDLDQLCIDADRRAWRCGLAAGSALLRFTRGKLVTCKGNSRDRQGRLIAVCSTDTVADLGREMVLSGMAFANSAQSKKYLPEQGMAKNAARGIWRAGDSGVVSPKKWRDAKQRAQ